MCIYKYPLVLKKAKILFQLKFRLKRSSMTDCFAMVQRNKIVAFVITANDGIALNNLSPAITIFTPCLSLQEFYVRRVHCLLTDFILHMPLRVRNTIQIFLKRLFNLLYYNHKSIMWFFCHFILLGFKKSKIPFTNLLLFRLKSFVIEEMKLQGLFWLIR